MRSTMVALAALLLVVASPAFARGGDPGSLELGVYFGHAWLDDYGIFHPDNDNILGARAGFFFSKLISIEGSAQKVDTDTEFDILGLTDTKFKLKSYRGNLMFNFGEPGHFRPFLTVGAGNEKTSVEGFGESCDFGWNAGGGFRIPLGHTFGLRLDGRYVSVKVGDEVDESQHNVEATAGLSLFLGGHRHEVEEIHSEAPPNQPPTVTCSVDRAQILPGESATITVTATDPEGGPITYDYTSSGGHVVGTGASATFDFASVAPPSTSTVTVRVTDDHGNTATCDATVALMAPQPKAEAVSCIAGGFPKNLSRITNVDKACLDDVAQRLGADPRAHVVIIGNADSHERGSDLAQRRADAIRDYLVHERNVEGSRVETRSAGSTKMIATGSDAASQAQNRRVEVWFVPEGAQGPQ